MRALLTILAAIIVLAWLGFELKDRYRDVSQVLFGVSALLAIILAGAFFGLYS